MSRIVATAPRYQGLGYVASHAVGEDSRRIRNRFMDFFEALSIVMSVQPRRTTLAELNDIYRECSQENWDGEGAQAMSVRTYQEAVRFLCALPFTIGAPEVIPEPNGPIGFQWRSGPNAVFVASVNGTQRISYAGLFGKGVTAYGTEDFSDAIPETIIGNLNRLRQRG
jgi:hypothetical protein